MNTLVNDRMKSVPIEDFGAHVQRMHANEDKWLELEYKVSTAIEFVFNVLESCYYLLYHTGHQEVASI